MGRIWLWITLVSLVPWLSAAQVGAQDSPARVIGSFERLGTDWDSIATPQARPWATSHELGHNFNAIHSAGECLPTGQVTLMAEKGAPPCSDGSEVRINVFSAINRGRINNYV